MRDGLAPEEGRCPDWTAVDAALSRWIAVGLARTSHGFKRIGAPNQRKLFCISYDAEAVDRLFVDLSLDAHQTATSQITLDLDATDDPLHGEQEGRPRDAHTRGETCATAVAAGVNHHDLPFPEVPFGG